MDLTATQDETERWLLLLAGNTWNDGIMPFRGCLMKAEKYLIQECPLQTDGSQANHESLS
jgi:hypothetical protein